MAKRLLVIEVAGLSNGPKVAGLEWHNIQSVFPALTCTVQASFRTASFPKTHGMVANGRFLRTLQRPMFWEQSAALVEGPRIWTNFRNRGKRVGMLFWQQSLGETVDLLLSPAPIHRHHGGIIQACYSKPDDLYAKLCSRIGRPFKLKHYWGPSATWKVGEWIVDAIAGILEEKELAPDLCFTYLPSLDYDLQRKNPETDPAASTAFGTMTTQLSRLVQAAVSCAYEVLIFGDYRIRPVYGAIHPNVALRKAGLMAVRHVKKMTYPDFYASRAFAMTDHEIAHVYIKDPTDISGTKDLLAHLPGVSTVLDLKEQEECHLCHKHSGELVIIASQGKWFAYPWWTNQREAPDFAGHVDIHNKPGYDPCELFFGWPPGSVSQNADRIRGSHGSVGPGREVTWAATVPIPGNPVNLVELAEGVRSWLG